MKALHFLENDNECSASLEDVNFAKMVLSRFVQQNLLDSMHIHYRFGELPKEDAYNIVFEPDNIIVTKSCYVAGSDSQFLNFVASAASNKISNICYIDTSGMLATKLQTMLQTMLKSRPNAILAICGINSNNILTVKMDKGFTLKRITVNLKGYYDNWIEESDIQNIFGV